MNKDNINPCPSIISVGFKSKASDQVATWDQIRVHNQYDIASFKDAPPVKSFSMSCVAGDVMTVDIEYYGGDPNDYSKTIIRSYVVRGMNMSFMGEAFNECSKEIMEIEEDKYKGDQILEF